MVPTDLELRRPVQDLFHRRSWLHGLDGVQVASAVTTDAILVMRLLPALENRP
jgi:hypothetical protein